MSTSPFDEPGGFDAFTGGELAGGDSSFAGGGGFDSGKSPFHEPSMGELADRANAVEEWEEYADLRDGETIEDQSTRVLTAVEVAFKARAQAENKRATEAVDPEYWCCLVFQSRRQKEEFLAAVGASLPEYGDKYLDGPSFAALIGRPVAPEPKSYNITPRLDAKWLELARELSDVRDEPGSEK